MRVMARRALPGVAARAGSSMRFSARALAWALTVPRVRPDARYFEMYHSASALARDG